MSLLRDWYAERRAFRRDLLAAYAASGVPPSPYHDRISERLYAFQQVGFRYGLNDRRLAAAARFQARYLMYVREGACGEWAPKER